MSHYCNNCEEEEEEEVLGKSSKNKINEIRGHQVQKLIQKLDIIQKFFVSWLLLTESDDELELFDNINNNNDSCTSSCRSSCRSSCSCNYGKHGGQEISILNHLKRINAFHHDDHDTDIDIKNNTNNTIIAIELGCGTGRLSDKLQQITISNQLNHILIDRYKFDFKQCCDRIMNQRSQRRRGRGGRIEIKTKIINNHHQQKSTTSKSTTIQRIVMDIANLDINQFNNIIIRNETKEDGNNCNENNDIFIMSKHLCGPACDLAISAIGRYCYCCCCSSSSSSCSSNSNSNSNSNISHSNNNNNNNNNNKTTTPPQPQPSHPSQQRPPPPPVVIATCCHYLCTWESFEGRTMWEILNLTKEDFEVAVAISQWASVKTSSSTSKTKKRKKTNSKQQQQQQQPEQEQEQKSEEEETKKKKTQKSSSFSSETATTAAATTTTTTKTTTSNTTTSRRTPPILLPNLLELAKEAGDAVIVAANQKNKITTTKEEDSSYLYNIPSDEFERTFSRNSKAKLGRTIKRLLDLSRASKLQQYNYKYVELIRYTTNSIDDRLLVAYNKQTNN